MIRKSAERFSGKIMCKRGGKARWRLVAKPSCLFRRWLVLAGLTALVAVTPQMAHADYKKVGPDARTPAQLAEAECSARANSTHRVDSALPADSIGMAIRRNFYVKDCLAERGFKKPVKKRRKIDYNR